MKKIILIAIVAIGCLSLFTKNKVNKNNAIESEQEVSAEDSLPSQLVKNSSTEKPEVAQKNNLVQSSTSSQDALTVQTTDSVNLGFQGQDYKVADWLIEVSSKINQMHFVEVSTTNIPDGSKIVEQTTDTGASIMQKFGADGVLENDEVLLPDGRVLSRSYNRDGSFREIYFEQSSESTYSASFNEAGKLAQLVSKVGDRMVTRTADVSL